MKTLRRAKEITLKHINYGPNFSTYCSLRGVASYDSMVNQQNTPERNKLLAVQHDLKAMAKIIEREDVL